ncbi:MAG: EamA family transporter RarD [Acidimicrobiales bacterium]|nr:EamA family transporter RarD [Acidimicrobiales bacterium]MCB9395052.1 EamA family transporter RarD [Acidimicrobiaceae bacterium]
MTEDDQRLRSGLIAGLTAYLVWGALTVYWKLLAEFDPFELVGWRVMSAALIMAAVLTVTRRWAHLRPVIRDRALLGRVVLAAVLLTCNWTAYVYAVVHDHVIETALGYFMAPLGTIAVGVVVFHERLSRLQRVAVAFGAASVVVLTWSYGRVPWVALILATTWSLYGWLKKQVPLTPLESMAAESFVVLVPAVVVATALAGPADSIPSSASAGQFVLVVLTGVATVVPLMLFAWAAHRVPLTVLGPMQYLVPSINFLLGWLAYDEDLPPSRVAGFALVWTGLVFVTVDTVRRSRPTPTGAAGHLHDRSGVHDTVG